MARWLRCVWVRKYSVARTTNTTHVIRDGPEHGRGDEQERDRQYQKQRDRRRHNRIVDMPAQVFEFRDQEERKREKEQQRDHIEQRETDR